MNTALQICLEEGLSLEERVFFLNESLEQSMRVSKTLREMVRKKNVEIESLQGELETSKDTCNLVREYVKRLHSELDDAQHRYEERIEELEAKVRSLTESNETLVEANFNLRCQLGQI